MISEQIAMAPPEPRTHWHDRENCKGHAAVTGSRIQSDNVVECIATYGVTGELEAPHSSAAALRLVNRRATEWGLGHYYRRFIPHGLQGR
jgi:hypothetical protein